MGNRRKRIIEKEIRQWKRGRKGEEESRKRKKTGGRKRKGEKERKEEREEKVDSGSDRNWARSTEVKLRKRERERG